MFSDFLINSFVSQTWSQVARNRNLQRLKKRTKKINASVYFSNYIYLWYLKSQIYFFTYKKL